MQKSKACVIRSFTDVINPHPFAQLKYKRGLMDPSLYKAATRGDVATLKRLLEVDPTILDSKTPQLNTALHLAALHGHTDFAGEVLNVKEELLVAKNNDGDSPLHLAARYGEKGVVELFVRRARSWPPEDPTTAEGPLRNPLMMTNKAGDTPLHDAVRNRRNAVALLLLDMNPDRGHDLNGLGESPLEIAAREGLVLVVERIVKHPWAQQVSVNHHVRGTALHQAVLARHIRILEILLEKRPELIDLTDSNGNNALHYAAKKNHARAVDILLNKRMNLAYKSNHEQQSPLHVAAHYGSTDAITALLRCCPDVAEMEDNNGHTAFHASVVSGKANAIRCLLRRVVRAKEVLNHVDKNGNTPRHLAASMSHINSALVLLNDGRVDPCVLNRDGQTARSLLEIRGEMDAYELHLWTQLMRHEPIWCRNQPVPPLRRHKGSASAPGDFRERLGIQVILASLVATVSFAATVTMPGGYSQTEGTAIHSHRAAFKIFLVSNTIAMSSSSVVLLCFLYPVKYYSYKVNQVLWGQRLTCLACLAMIVSFMTAVYVTVAPTVRWPVDMAMAIGASTPVLVILILGRQVFFLRL
ncbi:hypothetical protein SEVIR_7G294500v4 [Setaria viridis]|uniref:PGG domain-containing protein n=1 Tax=Setaria viridis TaxID=4556 RepID=A0A4U6TY06_SETVI|nr:ankyrin repeat-containing protein ITN1-like isoform X2 [Setaria viridis]TKW07232.1 hypothetical protein SEVIR_7G294500v2 [Setaria viridis]